MFASLNDRFSRTRKCSPDIARVVSYGQRDASIKVTVYNEYACRGPPPSAKPRATGIARGARPGIATSNHSSPPNNHVNSFSSSEHHRRSYLARRSRGKNRTQLHNVGLEPSTYHGYDAPETQANTRVQLTAHPVEDLRSLLMRRSQGYSKPISSPPHQFRVTPRNALPGQPDIRYDNRKPAGIDRTARREVNFTHREPPQPPPVRLERSAERGGFYFGKPKTRAPRPYGRSHFWQHDDRPVDRKPPSSFTRSAATHLSNHKTAFLRSHPTDEYIDDFNPEDLAKYKLEINQYPLQRSFDSSADPLSANSSPDPPEQWSCKQSLPSIDSDLKPDGANGSIPPRGAFAQESHVCLQSGYQLWPCSGVGATPRPRHVSEVCQPITRRPNWSELFRVRTWPCVSLALDTPGTPSDVEPGVPVIQVPRSVSLSAIPVKMPVVSRRSRSAHCVSVRC